MNACLIFTIIIFLAQMNQSIGYTAEDYNSKYLYWERNINLKIF